MINKVTLIGNLGRDPEIRTLDSGAKVARFSLATNESYRDKSGEWQTQTEWHNITCWRNLAERAERDLKKGSLVFIEGKISYRKYNDSEGRERNTTDIVALTFRLLEKRENSGYEPLPSAGDEPKYLQNSVTSDSSSTSPATESKDAPAMEDDDLPF